MHDNVSRNGYENAIVGRYGGYFEEDIMRLMCVRAYRLTELDAPVKFAPHIEVRLGNARYQRGEQNKDIGGSARNTILALVRRTHPLIIGNSLSSQESHE